MPGGGSNANAHRRNKKCTYNDVVADEIRPHFKLPLPNLPLLILPSSTTKNTVPQKVNGNSKTYIVIDAQRKLRKVIKAETYDEFVIQVKKEYEILEKETIKLFSAKDNFEITKEYFGILEECYKIMILKENEFWTKKNNVLPKLNLIEYTDDTKAAEMVWKIAQSDTYISTLKEEQLEIISEMNVERVSKILKDNKCTYFEDITTVRDIKDAAERITIQNNEAKEIMDYMKLLKSSVKFEDVKSIPIMD